MKAKENADQAAMQKNVDLEKAAQQVAKALEQAQQAQDAAKQAQQQATKPQDIRQHEAARQPNPKPGGWYGVDPDLLKIYKPGVAWPLTFNKEQQRTATALADVILPKDHFGPPPARWASSK